MIPFVDTFPHLKRPINQYNNIIIYRVNYIDLPRGLEKLPNEPHCLMKLPQPLSNFGKTTKQTLTFDETTTTPLDRPNIQYLTTHFQNMDVKY